MKKIKDLVKRHKLLTIIVGLAALLFIIILCMFIWMMVSKANSYGSRLDGIEEVEFEKDFLSEQATKLEENDEVASATCRLQGKIVHFVIYFNKGTSQDKAKELASATLDNFSEEEKAFYDFEYILTEDSEEETDEESENLFIITGTKQNKNDSISWSRN